MARFPRIDRYFLIESHALGSKKQINMKAVGITIASLCVLFVLSVLFCGGSHKKQNTTPPPATPPSAPPQPGTTGTESSFWYSPGAPTHTASGYHREHSASQLVKRGDNDSSDKLPMGSTVPVRLMNEVVSSDSAAPVIAEVTDDVFWKNEVVIPRGSRALGRTSLDDIAHRLQVRFQTIVFPEGEEHSVSGLGLLPDGSSGLPGDYHSGALTAEAGRFLGYFVGGMTSGMEDTTSQGQFGLPYNPGSLKNGLLNGVSKSTTDSANEFSESLKNVHPYLEVPKGVSFLLYLERAFP